jgi:hypothetical protein
MCSCATGCTSFSTPGIRDAIVSLRIYVGQYQLKVKRTLLQIPVWVTKSPVLPGMSTFEDLFGQYVRYSEDDFVVLSKQKRTFLHVRVPTSSAGSACACSEKRKLAWGSD